jgi:hypothetical protein
MDVETFEAIHRLEARIDGLREAIWGMMVILTHREPDLTDSFGTQLFGAFVDSEDKNPHEAMLDELRRLGNDLTSLKERRAESEGG